MLDVTFKLIEKNDGDRLALCFNSLSLIAETSILSEDQYSKLFFYIHNLKNDSSPLVAIRCGALKLIGTLSRSGFLPTSYLGSAIQFVLSQNSSTNQNVIISSSFALSFLCLNPISSSFLNEIVWALEENSKNKKEKIVSSAIISIGNLFETFGLSELRVHLQKLLDLCLNGLYHKNSKVGWDSCNSLSKFYDYHTEVFHQMSDKFIPIFIDTILNHHNYRTRINTCQLIRKYDKELEEFDIKFITEILIRLENDKRLVISDATVLKYQRYFRQELVYTFAFVLNMRSNLDYEFAEMLSGNLCSVYEWLKEFIDDLNKNKDEELFDSQEAVETFKDALKKIIR